MQVRRILAPALALILVAVLAGCALLPTRGVIGYSRSGGFAGFSDKLVIAPDGSAVLTDRGVETRFTVPGETLAALEDAFAAADFRHLPGSTPPAGSADMFEYTFTWHGHAVHVAEEIPAPLVPAATILAGIVEAHRPG